MSTATAGRSVELAPPARWTTIAGVNVGLLELLLLATVVTITCTKFFWEQFGTLTFSNLLASLYIAAYAIDWARTRSTTMPRAIVVLGGFWLAFTAIYLAGFISLDTVEERSQFFKALATWLVHGTFMLCAAAHLVSGGVRLLRLTVFTLLAGFTVNAGYAIAQLAAWTSAGLDLDTKLIAPLPFAGDGKGGILNYGGGIFRVNGLTRDTNHLGVMLAVPIVLGMGWLRGSWRTVVVGVCALALVLTLSRSGIVALAGALLVMAVPLRTRLLAPRIVVPTLGVIALLVAATMVLAQVNPELARSLIFGRLDPSTGSSQVHVKLYALIPQLLPQAPLFGLGLNSFALHFEDVSGGREGFGPHSFYIKLLVETGLVGFTAFLAFAGWLLRGLWLQGGMPAISLAAAIAGTLVGNVFYLTTQIMYVDLLFALAVATPVVLGINYNRATMPTDTGNLVERSNTPSGADASRATSAGDRVDVGDGLRGAMQYWWLVLLAVVVAVGIAAVRTGSATELSQASATVYIGQPVSPNGALLNTVSAKAATAIEIGSGDEALAAAAQAADVPVREIRDGLAVTALQSPLASKLQNPPTLMKVTVRHEDGAVAEKSVGAIAQHLIKATTSFSSSKHQSLESQLAAAQEEVKVLEAGRASAVKAVAAGGPNAAVMAVLAAQISGDLQGARADVYDVQAELDVANEIEQSRIVSDAKASKLTSSAQQPALVMAIFIGLVVGLGLALLAARLRRP